MSFILTFIFYMLQFGIHEKVSFDDFKKWSHSNCPHVFCGVHNWVYTILTGSKMPSEQETAPVPLLERFVEEKYCMSMGMLWALSAVIPPCYTHTDSKETEQQGEQQLQGQGHSQGMKNPLLTSFNLIMKLARLTRCQSWTLLYDSSDHGLSLNRFSHHVSSYNGPTISLFSFEGRNIFCVAEDRGWREGSNRFGGDDSMFLQITPVFRVLQAGGPMVLWSEYSRGVRPGIGIGKDPKSQVLFLPSNFERIEHYDVACELDKIEVWGCGTTAVKEAQIKQKAWEKKETERQATRKLRLEPKWDENPDKQILSMAGINTEHQYSREGGF
ncbi:hypothetical protein KUTeg_009872 [Tegillarca granosa]|uniref:TLDc domain-containing protein n=1 Tax=Tegillarca granosa TaxID=220873 RepID=A0ABQ9F541_TEGGR|nr:hypothetical protein KUTeg_023519 [Tegillarca granosa]KAJ8312499.1 hypothetical protein KUTeg_009872 [Tegillarca granosa]